MKTDPKAFAFPNAIIADGMPYVADGLTKREYFAAMAMQGILTRAGDPPHLQIARDAVSVADALINALNSHKPEGQQ